MTVVVGTAGHIDHGKTSLLRALTGTDADRLPEERRRGMTIDVGYAFLRLPDGTTLDFVDVPGHDRLVGNMLVGAGEVEAALLVVAADDGPRAQTLEHLGLLDALGIRHALAVVTKSDVAGDERTAIVIEAVHRLIDRTTMSGSPVLSVASPSGAGIDELRAALVGLRDRVVAGRPSSAVPSSPPVRLPIDRVFAVKGRGAVVTGSLTSGSIETGDALRLEPGGRTVRARGIQVHGGPVDRVSGGGRVALNLTGVETTELARGMVLTTGPGVLARSRVLAIVHAPVELGEAGPAPVWPPRAGATFRLHIGTASVDATIRRGLRDGTALPDGRQVVTVRLARPIAVGPDDRFVLRVPSPPATAAGGIVLDLDPPLGATRRRTTSEALAALAEAHLAGSPDLELAARLRLHGWLDTLPPATDDEVIGIGRSRRIGTGALDGPIASALEAAALTEVDAHHEHGPLAAGLPLAQLRKGIATGVRRLVTVDERSARVIADAIVEGLVGDGRLVRSGELVRDPRRSTGTLPPDVLAAMSRLEAALAVPAPPPLGEAARRAGCPAEGVRGLVAAGRIVRVDDDLAWAGSTYRDLEALALRLATPGPLTPATLRDATGTSRKYVMALLEDLDRRGILRRTADGHVAGPRASR